MSVAVARVYGRHSEPRPLANILGGCALLGAVCARRLFAAYSVDDIGNSGVSLRVLRGLGLCCRGGLGGLDGFGGLGLRLCRRGGLGVLLGLCFCVYQVIIAVPGFLVVKLKLADLIVQVPVLADVCLHAVRLRVADAVRPVALCVIVWLAAGCEIVEV